MPYTPYCIRLFILLTLQVVWGCTSRTTPDNLATAYLAVLAQAQPEAEKQFLQQQTQYEPLFLTVLQHTDSVGSLEGPLQRLCICWMQKDLSGFFAFLQKNYSEQGKLNAHLLTTILGWFYEQQEASALEYLSAFPLSQSGWRACCLTQMMAYLTQHHPQQALAWALAEDPYRYAKIQQWMYAVHPAWLPELALQLNQLVRKPTFRDAALVQTFLMLYLNAHGDVALHWFLTELPDSPVRHQLLPDFVRYGATFHPEAMLRLCNDSTFIRDALSHEPPSSRQKRYTDVLAAFLYGAAQSAKPELAQASLDVLTDKQQAFALRHWVYSCMERSAPQLAWQLLPAQPTLHRYPIPSFPIGLPSWPLTEVFFAIKANGRAYTATHTDKDWVVNIETPNALDIHITPTGIACQSAFFERLPFPVSSCQSDTTFSFRVHPGTNYHLRFEQGYSLLVSVF